MRLGVSQFQLQPAVREQAAQTLAAGHTVTLTAPSHGLSPVGFPAVSVGEPGLATNLLYGLQAAGVPLKKPLMDNIAEVSTPLNMGVGLARDAAVEYIRSLHPTLGVVLSNAFTIFDLIEPAIENISVVKVGDRTAGAVAVTAIDGLLRRHFILRPHIGKDEVEIGIQEQHAG